MRVPEVVRQKALTVGAGRWLDDLPLLVASLERDWSIVVGDAYTDSTEASSPKRPRRRHAGRAEAPRAPRRRCGRERDHRLATDARRGLRATAARRRSARRALARTTRPLALRAPTAHRHTARDPLLDSCARLATAPDCGLPTGAEKGRWLADFITATWEELDHPCSKRAVDHAIACAERRIDAHRDERAVLVHGDVHQWNALEAEDGFKLVDPDGLLAEPEYDLGILMREDPLEISDGDPHERARWLAAHTGLDATSIWEWGVVERVSTGLLGTKVGLQPIARQMLAVADRLAAH